MDKDKLLEGVRQLSQSNDLSREELLEAYESSSNETREEGRGFFTSISFFDVLFYVGALLVVTGITVLMSYSWSQIPTIGRISSTLGAGLGALGFAMGLESKSEHSGLTIGLHCIAAPLIPTGMYVFLHEYGIDIDQLAVSTMVSGAVFMCYLLVFFVVRSNLSMFFSTVFGTWFYYSAVYYLLPLDPGQSEFIVNISAYLTLFLGLSYVFFGYFTSGTDYRNRLTWFYYFFGTAMTLGGAYYFLWKFNIMGTSSVKSWLWVVAFPFFLFAFFYSSVQLNSKSMLGLSSLFLIIYINHFAWIVFSGPLFGIAVIISGISVIGIGYATVKFQAQYLEE